MKWRTVSLSLLAVTLLLALAGVLLKLLPIGDRDLLSRNFAISTLQLGYYDLLARQREIYDTRVTVKDKTALMSLTSPNDNRFFAKISLEQTSGSANSVTFDFHQIYYADSGSPRMIKNILGYAQNNGVRFETLEFGNERILITPSGQIFNYH